MNNPQRLGHLPTKRQRVARRKRSEMLTADIEKYYGLGQGRLRSISFRHKYGVPCARHPKT